MKDTKVKQLFRQLVPAVIFLLVMSNVSGQYAPIITSSNVFNAEPGEQVTIPVTVTNFDNIGGFTLTLDYNYDEIQFVSGTQNSSLGGTFNIGDIDLGNRVHRLTVSWFKPGNIGVTLEDGSTLVEYVFTFLKGPAQLNWFENGPSCEFTDPGANVLIDIPKSEYYHNAIVSEEEFPKPVITTDGPTTFYEGEQVILTSSTGNGYLWSTGDTTKSIVVTETGSYTVQTKNEEGLLSEKSESVDVNVISVGDALLSFRLANPKIINEGTKNYFIFDVQVKADAVDTWLWESQINLNFKSTTLSAKDSNWMVTPGTVFQGNNSLGNSKYSISLSISGNTAGIDFSGDESAQNLSSSANDFVEVSAEYETLVSVKALIISNTGVAGVSFKEDLMNGKQLFKISSAPWYSSYAVVNNYTSVNFSDIYVSRIYSLAGWSQVAGLDWTKVLNTSIWEGNATLPEGNLCHISNLKIHDPATLSVPASGKLTVYGASKIDTEEGLIIQSDETGTGSVIASSVSGSAVAEQYIETETWEMVSPPLKDQSITNFLSMNSNIGSESDGTTKHMTNFDASSGDWNSYFTSSASGTLEPGTGYFMRVTNNGVIEFSGTVQTDDFLYVGVVDKWNIIGNPYTSAIRLNSGNENNPDFLNENSDNLDPVYGAVYMWNEPDESNGYIRNYSVISNASKPIDIKQGQAFFVKLNSESESVSFKSGMRVHNPLMQQYSANLENHLVKLQATSNSNIFSTLVSFKEGMSNGLDPTFDAGLYSGNTDLVIYSKLVEDSEVPFAIQALPIIEYSETVIPIGIEFKTGGEVVFSAELTNMPNSAKVVLEDTQNQILTDLTKGNYTVEIEADFSNEERFILHITYLATDAELKYLENDLKVFFNRNEQIIINGNVSGNTIAKLYDLQGRLFLNKKLTDKSYNKLQLPAFKPGIYVLNIQDLIENNIQSFKIPIFQ